MKYIDVVGNIAAIAGILICAVAGLSRLAGAYYLLGFQTLTLFNGGIALMVMACLAKIHHMSASKTAS